MLRIWCQTYFSLNIFEDISTQLTVYRRAIVSEGVIKGRNVWKSQKICLGHSLVWWLSPSWSLASLHLFSGSLLRVWNVGGEPLEYKNLRLPARCHNFCGDKLLQACVCPLSPDHLDEDLWTREAKGAQVQFSIIFKQPEQNLVFRGFLNKNSF